VEDVRSNDEAVQLFDKKFVLDIESLDKHDQHVDILRIVLAFLVLAFSRWRMDYALNKSFNHIEVDLLREVFLISVKLSECAGLAHFQTALVRQQDREILINSSLVLRALTNEPVDEFETNLKNLLVPLI
jgi:hypothetical protein